MYILPIFILYIILYFICTNSYCILILYTSKLNEFMWFVFHIFAIIYNCSILMYVWYCTHTTISVSLFIRYSVICNQIIWTQATWIQVSWLIWTKCFWSIISQRKKLIFLSLKIQLSYICMSIFFVYFFFFAICYLFCYLQYI